MQSIRAWEKMTWPRLAILAVLLLPIVALMYAPLAADSREPPNAAGPKLSVDNPKHDFGTSDSFCPVKHAYTIRNTGDAPLQIKRVTPTCGCASVETSVRTVAPRMEASVVVRLDLARRNGRVRESILVESNDPARPAVRLDIEGTAIETVSVRPFPVAFNNVPNDAPTTQPIDVSALSTDAAFRITGIRSDLPFVTAAAEPIDALKHRVTISTNPPVPPGPVRGTIRLMTDHKGHPAIDIPVLVTAVQELSVVPREIILIDRGSNAPATRFITIAPGKVKQFTVKSVEAPLPSVAAKLTARPDGACIIQLLNLVPGPDIDGKSVRITTDAKGMEEIRVRFRTLRETPQ